MTCHICAQSKTELILGLVHYSWSVQPGKWSPHSGTQTGHVTATHDSFEGASRSCV